MRLSDFTAGRFRDDKVITPELARYLTELSSEIGRQIGLLITRDGKITHVIVGDAKGVFISGLEDFPLGKRARCAAFALCTPI